MYIAGVDRFVNAKSSSQTKRPLSWDVFCKVVDNYGDAAVCWRLARQLALLHSGRVRLWLDDPSVLHALCPEVSAQRTRQEVAGVEIHCWRQDSVFESAGDVVIDGFGGGLPQPYLEAALGRTPHTLWITLEYLSAESWVAGHHGLPSRPPRLDLERYFFFPGFVPGTGGLLKESDLESRRGDFQGSAERRARFWEDLGFAPAAPGATVVSLFSYANPATSELFQAWASATRPVVAAIPNGPARVAAETFLGAANAADGASFTRGHLEIRLLPFLPQRRYDELLWASDWNFVRGEDSFVRAQWACRPFVWHIYPQEARAHWVKLDAFLAVYCAGLEPAAAGALRAFWHAWNGVDGEVRDGSAKVSIGSAWSALQPHEARLRKHAEAWAQHLLGAGDLAANLASFCADRLK